MAVADKRVAILVHDYVEQSEFEEPLKILKDRGLGVTVISANVPIIHGMQHEKLGEAFQSDELLVDADPDSFDALVLPGGALNADMLRMNEKAQVWATHFLQRKKLVAAICHAPWLLISANLVSGRRLTSYFSIQDDVRNARGIWTDQPVVIDGSLITSRGPDDIPAFVDTITTFLTAPPAETSTA